MNLVGKILTLLIFVMSIAFMVMAIVVYQTHTNWRDLVKRSASEVEAGKPLGLEHQVTKLKTEKQRQKAMSDSMLMERDNIKKIDDSTIARLETENTELKADNVAKDQKINTYFSTATESSAGIQAAHETLKDMRSETTQLRGNIRDAQAKRDSSFKDAITLADQLHQAETELKRLEARSKVLVRDNDRMRTILRSSDMNPDGNPAQILPNVKGLVLAMPGKGLMEISIGKDDGLQPGHHLEVYRIGAGMSTYLGRVEVVRTAPDKAVCKILPEYRKGSIRTGDRIASKLE